MRKPTGPGKVQDDLLLPPAVKTGRSALLFNFDFDDATVKLEHEDWLRSFAVPVLRTSRNTRIALKGLASRKGASSYNDKLSQRRMEAVRKFLLGQQVSPSQFDTSFVGESEAMLAGRADGTDEEIDRAVSVDVKTPVRGGAAIFDDPTPGVATRGFERNGSPQWLMVPALFRRRALRLRNAEGMQVRTTNPSVVRLRSPSDGLVVNDLIAPSDNFLIEFVGGLPGKAVIEVIELTGEIKRRLEIDVLPRREVAVGFHYVSDKVHATTRVSGSVRVMIEDCNTVFNDAANIFFTAKFDRPLAFPIEDMGDPMTERTAGINFSKLTARRDPAARFNVFYVWEWQRIAGRDTDARVDAIPGRNVVFEDNAGRDIGVSLAHEFAHCLGLEHTADDDLTLQPRLMWPFTDERGTLLTREEAVRVNGNV